MYNNDGGRQGYITNNTLGIDRIDVGGGLTLPGRVPGVDVAGEELATGFPFPINNLLRLNKPFPVGKPFPFIPLPPLFTRTPVTMVGLTDVVAAAGPVVVVAAACPVTVLPCIGPVLMCVRPPGVGTGDTEGKTFKRASGTPKFVVTSDNAWYA